VAAELVVRIVGDSTSLRKELDRSTKASKKFGRDIENAGRGATVAALGFHGLGRAVGYASASFLGAAGLTAAAKAGFDEMFAGQKVAAQTAAALESTGRVAGVTANQINTLAGSLQKLTGYDDEAIQSAENLLLTFTNVRNVAGRNNDIFNQATEATLNLSRTFDQDLSSSAVQLGKALQDPVRGVTALRRIGVSFTSAQQKLIDRLVSTGDVLGAQKIILREVTRETGNSARAYGQTLPGQLDILKGNLQNLAGELAKTVAPEVENLTTQFNKWLEDPENKKKVIDDFAAAMHGLGVMAKFAADTIGTLKSVWDALPDFSKNKGILDLIPGGNVSGLDLLHKLGIGGGGGGGGGAGGNLFSPGFKFPNITANIPPPRGPVSGGAAPPGVVPPPPQPRGAGAQQRNAWFDAMINRQLSRVQDITSLKGQITRLQQIGELIQQRMDATKDITRRLTLEDKLLEVQRTIRSDRAEQAQNAADAAQRTADAAQKAAEAAKAARQAAAERNAAAQQAVLDQLQFNVDQTQLTKGTQDDLARLKEQEAGIRKIIATEGSTLDLRNQLLAVELAINSKNQEIAAARQAGRDAIKQAAADAEQSKLDWAQLAIDRAGLTDTLTDNLKAEQNMLAIINQQIAAHGKTLSLEQQKVGILGQIKDTRKQQADQAAQAAQAGKDATDKALADVTQANRNTRKLFKTLNATAFVNQFGADLTRGQKRRLEVGLAMMGPGGTIPRGAGRGGQFTAGVTINGGVHMHGVQDVPGLENQIAKRAKARPHVRRGARG